LNVRGRGRRGRAQAGWIVPLRDGGQVVVRRNRGAGGWFTLLTVSGGTDEVKEMFGAGHLPHSCVLEAKRSAVERARNPNVKL
jgi:hypothetical protein